MKVLLAEDEAVTRTALQSVLAGWGYEVSAATDGPSALRALQAADAPPLALIDLVMPGLDGVEVCRQARAAAGQRPLHMVILTARPDRADVVAALSAGADDYIVKPFNPDELRVRLQVGARIVTLHRQLADRVAELEQSLAREQELQSLLPICAYCHKVRDDRNYWEKVESYLGRRAKVKVSHSICPDCYQKIAKPELDEYMREQDGR